LFVGALAFLFSQSSACRLPATEESLDWKPSGFVLADKVSTGWKGVGGNETWRQIYAKPGETAENWTEKAEVIELPIAITLGGTIRWNPESLMSAEKDRVEKLGCSTDAWTVLQHDESSILWEWRRIKCPGYLEQHEIERIVMGQWYEWEMFYAIRNRDFSSDEKTELIKDLMRAKVIQKGR